MASARHHVPRMKTSRTSWPSGARWKLGPFHCFVQACSHPMAMAIHDSSWCMQARFPVYLTAEMISSNSSCPLIVFLFAEEDYEEYLVFRRVGAASREAEDLDDDDEAGEFDALCEGMCEGQGEEEVPAELDALVEVQGVEPVTDTADKSFAASTDGDWLPNLKKQQPLKLDSSLSIGTASVASTIVTPSRNPALPEVPSGALTPSPVSPPVDTKVREIYLIAESPLKMAKTEIDEDTCPERVASILEDGEGVAQPPEPAMNKESAMRELALLEARLFQSQFGGIQLLEFSMPP